MTRLSWLGVLSVSVMVGAAGVGCAVEEANTAPAVSPTAADGIAAGSVEDDQATVELKQHHRHHHGGFAGFVLAAVETVDLSSEQEAAVAKIKADFKAKTEPEMVFRVVSLPPPRRFTAPRPTR